MPLSLNDYDISILRELADKASYRGTDVPVAPSALRELLDAFEDSAVALDLACDEGFETGRKEGEHDRRELEEELSLLEMDIAEKNDRIQELEDHIAAISGSAT